jgi:hypothetical protein
MGYPGVIHFCFTLWRTCEGNSFCPGGGGDSSDASLDPVCPEEFLSIFLMRAAVSGDTSATRRCDKEDKGITRLQLRPFSSDTAIIYNSGTYRMLWKKTSS